MRSFLFGVAGTVFGIALVANCGPGGGIHEVLDMMGLLDGQTSTPKDGLIGNADATPGNPAACTPSESFCEGSRIWSCTYSGKDAVFGTDCATQGTANNPGTCLTMNCSAGAKACCGRQKLLWKGNFTQPSLVGASYGGSYETGGLYLSIGKSCGSGSSQVLVSAAIGRPTTACGSSNLLQIAAIFDRTKITAIGANLPFPTDGMNLYATIGDVTCSTWTGTMKIDSDLPNWSVTINATCSEAGKGSVKVVGTMSGSE